MKHPKMSIFGNKGKPDLLNSSSKTVSDILGVEHKTRPLPATPQKEKSWSITKSVRSLLKKREEKTPVVITPVNDAFEKKRKHLQAALESGEKEVAGDASDNVKKIMDKFCQEVSLIKIENLILSQQHLEKWMPILNTASIGPNYETFKEIHDSPKFHQSNFLVDTPNVDGEGSRESAITSYIYDFYQEIEWGVSEPISQEAIKDNIYNTVILSDLYIIIDEAAPGKYGPLLQAVKAYVMAHDKDNGDQEHAPDINSIFDAMSQIVRPSTFPILWKSDPYIQRMRITDFTIVLCEMTDTFKRYTSHHFIHPQRIPD